MKISTIKLMTIGAGCTAAAFALVEVYGGNPTFPAPAHATPHTAATAPAAPADTTSSLAQLSQSSGPWAYRCLYGRPPAGGPVLCSAEQRLTTQDPQKKAVPVGVVAFSRERTATGFPTSYRVAVQMPLMVSLVRPPTIAVDDGTPVPLTWQVCSTRGCIASVPAIPDAWLVDARHGKIGHIQIGTIQGASITINFALADLDTALNTLDNWAHRQSPS
ncbi:conserved hypothetical protein [Gluconacetobacter diazotrophicus PA1 5]|uniref:Invasion protein n=2 Tax=Gluconacetobacter diazotrophicus TaxID=33996 RepID=A0A7W4I5Q7_GLUDI|nr:invasion associated locus B family protein [Gluconacetobacter diazotrophicus]ACI52605.1 conserved hypothetical protein [Gluconacetobacter diazotrophicus PA1 5]MBB2156739.1 invasion protein [Gluconacetobacter diazotrophicus]TWB03144.1 invasion protein IalB [Gluconacetobacter diazotrophicus]